MEPYVPFEYPATADGKYTAVLNEGQILLTRRSQLGLTQHQVAEMAGLCLSQYQRLEGSERFFSGCSVRIGLAVCSVLLLDPRDIVHPNVQSADRTALKPVPLFGESAPHRAGRKQIRRDIMSIGITPDYIFIPENVITALGKPPCIRCQREQEKRRILLSAAEKADADDVFFVPEKSALTIPYRSALRPASQYTAKCRLVRDRKGALFVLCDLTTASME